MCVLGGGGAVCAFILGKTNREQEIEIHRQDQHVSLGGEVHALISSAHLFRACPYFVRALIWSIVRGNVCGAGGSD